MEHLIKKVFLIFTLSSSITYAAESKLPSHQQELDAVKLAAKAFPSESSFPKTDHLSYRGAIDDLKRKYETILSSGLTSSYFGFPIPVSQLISSQAELSRALLRDWQAIDQSGEIYRLPTYLDTKARKLEPDRLLRLELAHELYTISLLRSSLANIHHSFLSPTKYFSRESGLSTRVTRNSLLKMAETSPVSQNLLAKMSSSLLQDYLNLEEDLFKMTSEASAAGPESSDRLTKKLNDWTQQRQLMGALLDNFQLLSPHSLTAAQRIRDRKFSGDADLINDARALGLGFQRSLAAAKKFVDDGGLTNHTITLPVEYQGAEFVIHPDLIPRIIRRMAGVTEHGGGGTVYSNVTLPEAAKADLMQHFETLLLEHYITVAAASSGRIKQQSKAISTLKKLLGFSGTQLTSPTRLENATTSRVESTDALHESNARKYDDNLSPQNLEYELWRTFAEATGLGRAPINTGTNGCVKLILMAGEQ